jgi:hypothetical protein
MKQLRLRKNEVSHRAQATMANFVPSFCCCPRKIIYASALAVRNSFSAETAGTLKLSNKTQIYLISPACQYPASDYYEFPRVIPIPNGIIRALVGF